jgi:hypothetical protein
MPEWELKIGTKIVGRFGETTVNDSFINTGLLIHVNNTT